MSNGLEQKIVTVGTVDYTLQALPSSKGLPLLARVTQHLAPVIGELSKFQDKVDGEGNVIEQASEDVDIGALSKSLFVGGTADFVALIQDLVRDVYKDGVTINMDKEFKRNYMSMFKLALEVIKFNFEDVFQELGFSLS